VHVLDTQVGEIPVVVMTFAVGVVESVHTTSYEVMIAPPSEVGGDHATFTAVPVFIDSTTEVGWPGTVAGGLKPGMGTGTGEDTGGSVITPPPGTVLNTGERVLVGEAGAGLDGIGDGKEGVGEAGVELDGEGEGEEGVGSDSCGTGTSPRSTTSIAAVGKEGWNIF
jgi:hypothetical protein